MELTTIYADDAFVLAGWHNVVVSVWYGNGAIEHIEAVRQVHRDYQERFPAGYIFLAVLRPRRMQGPPPKQILELGSQVKRESDGHVLANTVVIEQGGVKGAFMRSVVTGVNMLSRTRVPITVFPTLDEAVAWMADLPGPDDTLKRTAPDLTRTLRALQR
jgi:hypothetical protein